jgi:hypothetical protein
MTRAMGLKYWPKNAEGTVICATFARVYARVPAFLAVGYPRRRLSPAKVLRRKFPIGELINEGFHVVDAPILVVQIVGVLPNIDGQ